MNQPCGTVRASGGTRARRATQLGGLALSVAMSLVWASLLRAEDGLRPVDVKRFGVSVRVPQAWSLIDWARHDKAFVLQLPQDDGSPAGLVACSLSIAPASLDELKKQLDAAEKAGAQTTDEAGKLSSRQIETLDANRFGEEAVRQIGKRLVSVREHQTAGGVVWFEVQVCQVAHDTLFTLVLTSDEAHYDSYRLDFDDMLLAAKFTPPETGVQKLAGGYWLQRDYRFAVRLPDGWQPAFGPRDTVLFFATGQNRDSWTDQVAVRASVGAPLDLNRLKEEWPAQLKQNDPQAELVRCQAVQQATGPALETVLKTTRDKQAVVECVRQFRGQNRNYEVRVTVSAQTFAEQEAELLQLLNSFREVTESPPKAVF